MTDIELIVAQAGTLIRASAALSGVTVLEDDGYMNDAAEMERRDKGFVILIRQPDTLQVQLHAQTVTFCTASVIVVLSENPEVNAGPTGVGVNMHQAVQDVIQAMQTWDGETTYFHFQGAQLVQQEGLHERQLTFVTPVIA